MTLAGPVGSTRQRVAAQLAEPVYRSGYLLAANSLLSAAVGAAYWFFAARLYSPAVVGLNSTLISAMMFLAGIAQLNLMSLLLRFLPTLGHRAGRMIAVTYLLVASLGAVAGLVFLAGLSHFSPTLAPLLGSPVAAAGFVLATAGWTIYTVQSAALVALGRAGAATGLTQLFNLLKLALLVLAAAIAPTTGVWASWTLATGVAVVLGLGFLFARALPGFARSDRPAHPLPALADLARFAGPDYVASLAWIGCTSFVPILVLNLTDAEHSAAFALAWQICLVLYGVPIAFGQSLVAHTANDPARLAEHHRRIVASSLALLTPVVAVLVAAAPYLLAPFGSWYADQGATILRLLALSALPNAVVALAVSKARVTRQMGRVLTATVELALLVLGLTPSLVAALGIDGAGWAWLVGQLAVCAGLYLPVLAPTTIRSRSCGVPNAARRRVLQRLAADGWRVEATVRTVSDTTVALIAGPGRPAAVVKIAATEAGMASLQREREVLTALASRPALTAATRRVPAVVQAGRFEDCAYLVLHRLPGTEYRQAVGPEQPPTSAVLEAIAPLHRAATTQEGCNEQLLRRWVDEPIGRLRAAVSPSGQAEAALEELGTFLRDALAGRPLVLGWMHGDFYPGNVLLLEGEVTGLIDWGQADDHGLPMLDVAFWLLTLAAAADRTQLGEQVVSRLRSARCWSPSETAALAQAPGGGSITGRALLLLTWLHHVDENLAKSGRYRLSWIWLRRNVLPVLHEAQPGPAWLPSRAAATMGRTVGATAAAARAAISALRPPATVIPLAAALVLWLVSLHGVDLRAMNDVGLVSVLPATYWAGLGLVVLTLPLLIHTGRTSAAVLMAYFVALILILHATPAILYEAPRYSWTWKHVGIVDFIVRHGMVNPRMSDAFAVYQSWPGFFALNALLVKAGGLGSALSYAAWAPPVFELAALVPLRMIFQTLVDNQRQVWLALLVFYLGNWVGQDYFSPQAFAYLLYLLVLLVCLRWLPAGHRGRHRTALPRWRRWLADESHTHEPSTPAQRRALVAVVVLLMVAIVSSHQLTPFMLLLALTVLVLGRSTGPAWLPWLLAVLTAAWFVLMGGTFLGQNLYWIAASIAHPGDNAQTFVDLSHASLGQILVSWADRGLTGGIGLLALLGWLRMRRAGAAHRLPVLLAAAPAAMLVANSYGGEMLFRVFLFALPFLALLAAGALYPTAGREPDAAGRPRHGGTLAVALTVAMAAPFCLAYYGKERMNYFTPQEVAASVWLYDHAPTGSLIVAATASFPWAFTHYDTYRYTFLENLPPAPRKAITATPLPVLGAAVKDRSGPAFIVLTRAQGVSVRYSGTLPGDTVPVLTAALRRDAAYRLVYRNRDASIFELASPGSGAAG